MNKPIFSWRRWKLGLLVAGVTGLCTAFVAGLVFPDMTMKQALVVILGSVAKDILLFLNQHPVTEIEDTVHIPKP